MRHNTNPEMYRPTLVEVTVGKSVILGKPGQKEGNNIVAVFKDGWTRCIGRMMPELKDTRQQPKSLAFKLKEAKVAGIGHRHLL